MHARVDVPTEARCVLVRFLASQQSAANRACCTQRAHKVGVSLCSSDSTRVPAQVDTQRQAISQLSGASPGERARGDSMCYIIFTSGSTGRPKGAVMQHDGVLNNLHSLARYPLLVIVVAVEAASTLRAFVLTVACWHGCRRLEFSTEDVFLQRTPISFDVSVASMRSKRSACCQPVTTVPVSKAVRSDRMRVRRRPCRSCLAH